MEGMYVCMCVPDFGLSMRPIVRFAVPLAKLVVGVIETCWVGPCDPPAARGYPGQYFAAREGVSFRHAGVGVVCTFRRLDR